MPTLAAYVQRAIDLAGETLMGRYVPLTSLTTTTAVASSLAFGGNSEQRYAQWWMWRPNASADGDRIKQADSFAPSTGTLTHSGANYGDTTATGETLILLPPDLDPYKVRVACNMAVKGMREWDESIIPIIHGADTHLIADLDWLNDAASIRDVKWTSSPVISRNRYLQKRHTVDDAGNLCPDFWDTQDNAASEFFQTTTYGGQKWMYMLERANGDDAFLTQSIRSLLSGVSGDSPAGKTITAVLVAEGGSPGELELNLSDGTTTDGVVNTTGNRETLTASIELSEDAIDIGLGVIAGDSDGNHSIYECYAFIGSELTDAIRRDTFPRLLIPKNQYHFEQGGPLRIQYQGARSPGSFIICSERPFPGFDATRLASGAADTDEQDAPLDEVATGIVAITLEQRYGPGDATARLWRHKFDLACRKHLAYPTGNTGMPLLNGPITAPAMRVR